MAAFYVENASSTYNYAQLHLARGFTNFYKGRARVPKFKRKGRSESFTLAASAARLVGSHHVRLSRIGDIKPTSPCASSIATSPGVPGASCQSPSPSAGGKYYVAFSVEVTRAIPFTRTPERVIGIDVGLTTL